MIPQRNFSSDFAEPEIRERISECRKRLRLNRHRSVTFNDSPLATFPNRQGAMRESSINSVASGDHYEALLTMETQGIGIT